MPSASRTRAGKPHWVIYRFTMPRRANKRWKIRRGLEPVSCLKCVHPLFHEEEENCTTTFSDNPTENPPKIQSLPTHPRADVKVGVKFWSPQSVSGALQQKSVAAQLKTMGTTKKWLYRVCYIRCNPSLWKPRERIQPNDLRRCYLHPQPAVELVHPVWSGCTPTLLATQLQWRRWKSRLSKSIWDLRATVH